VALIKAGDISELSVTAQPAATKIVPDASAIKTFGVLAKATPTVPAGMFDFGVSAQNRGLALQKLLLEKNFQNRLSRVFDRTRKVYFLAWAWDFSGQPAYFYPGESSPAGTTLIPIKAKEEREFVGSGILLSPSRPITGGLAIRLQLWVSKGDARKLGKTMHEVALKIKQSNLNGLLAAIAVAGGVTTTTVNLVWNASLELSTVVGTILEASSDSHIDFYEGFFPAARPWSPKTQSWNGHASEITLGRLS
jgi:hypothetical protein